MDAKYILGLFLGVMACVCPAWRAAEQFPKTISHDGNPYCLCFHGNGRLLIAYSLLPGYSLVSWDLANDRAIVTIKKRTMYSCAASTDSNRIAYINEYFLNTKRAWKVVIHDLETDEELFQIEDVFRIQFSKNGKLLATLSSDGKNLRIHDADSGKELEKLPEHRSKVIWFDFSPDGKLLASLVESGLVRVWDVEAKKLRYYLPRQRTPIKAAAWSPDSKTLATMTDDKNDNELAFWDAEKGEARHGIDFLNKTHLGAGNSRVYCPISNVDQLCYSPDGRDIIIRSVGYFMFVDVKTEECRFLLSRGQEAGATKSFALSPDGKLIARIREKGGNTFITVEDFEEFRKLALPRKEFEELQEKLQKEREKK